MKRSSLQQLFRVSALTSATLLALSAHPYLQGRNDDRNDTSDRRDRGDDRRDGDDRQQSQSGLVTATGQIVTPQAILDARQTFLNPGLAGYPNFVAGEAVRSRLSPDGTTLAIITAGQNSLYKPDATVDVANSTQYIFLYDVSGANKSNPALVQVIQQANSHVGLVFSHDGNTLYAAGGNDDAVYVYNKSGGKFTAATPIALKHFDPKDPMASHNKGIGVGVQPNASGMDISADGHTLVVANNYNDSISVIDTATGAVRYEHDLRPWFTNNEGQNGLPGGTFPLGVAVKGNDTAYVTSDRDREVVAIDIASPTGGQLIKRIKLDGNGQGVLLDPTGTKLYVAQDNADQVAVIDTLLNSVVTKIDARAPEGVLPNTKYTGAATFAVTLSPDGTTLYAVNSGANSIAVIPVTGPNAYKTVGLIPTAYEPHDITFSADGSWMYIVNGKSITGPNPDHLNGSTAQMTTITYPGGNKAANDRATASNEYQFQLEHASLVSAPVPTSTELQGLTAVVARNNYYSAKLNEKDAETMAFIAKHIKHVIYVVKENRTFDQMLGDLTNGANADPGLAQFPQAITPNIHALATRYVTLDNFTNPGDGSMDGWSWAMQGRVTNTETITQQINYAAVNRGLSYESEGSNRNVPVNWSAAADRDAAAGLTGSPYSMATQGLPGGTSNTLAGNGNHASADAPFGAQAGYLYRAVLNAGGTVRNYGFHVNNIGNIGTVAAPISDPFNAGAVQVGPLDPELAKLTDVYFRGFDQVYPDLWRYNEWKREFDQYVANGNLPSLTQLRISHDHMGSFGSAFAGVTTPETQQADCDFATGLIVEAVANSRYASDTIIIFTEDDVQDGPDHVDSHRGPALVVGPYVKQGAVISTHFSQVNVIRTIEDILGTEHINLNTAFQRPMADVFDARSNGKWTYTAEASTILATTKLASADSFNGVIRYAKGPMLQPKHNAAYWAEATKNFDFSDADQVPPAQFNRVLWKGLMGKKPYPVVRGESSGKKADDDDRDGR
jgi:YVTN family beta-propeller protein